MTAGETCTQYQMICTIDLNTSWPGDGWPRSQAPPQLFVAYCMYSMQQKAGEEPGNEASDGEAEC